MSRLLLRLCERFSARPYHKLEQALAHPRKAQLQTLSEILALAATEPEIRTYRDFTRLPLQHYEDLEPRIQAAIASQTGWLSRRKPFNHEPTSGSSGAKKLIPYTTDLIQSFTTLFLCWAHDLLRYGPALSGGRIYFSVSPQFHDSEFGLQDDSDYLSGLTGLLFKRFSLVPSTVKKLRKPESFFRVVSLYLLAADDLEVISIWSPSFLLSFLDYIQTHRQQLISDLQVSSIEIEGRHFHFGRIDKQKLRALEQVDLPLALLFPSLKLISCWGAGNARAGYRQLQARFAGVLVQEKGLLATEAPLSFPSLKYGAFLPLLQEVFFEFIDAQGSIRLLDELEQGQTYEIVISQKSGLLRYRLKDSVQVTHKAKATPCFSFVQRSDEVCDLVGEKLNEHFIAGIAHSLCPEAYLCLVPDAARAGYTLFADKPVDPTAFEAALMASPHYQNARKLNQLSPLRLELVPDLAARVKAFYTTQRGMSLGDIKDRFLYSRETDGELAGFLRA